MAINRLAVAWLVAAIVLLTQHAQMPLPPHSAHDGFLLIPQLKQLLAGATPDEARFGMFNLTWFSPHALPTGSGGPSAFIERIFSNVQSHTWIDSPHPLILMSVVSRVLGLGTFGPVLVQLAYLGLLVGSLYAVGVKVHSREAGLVAGVLSLGTPAFFGTVQYIEPHLALAAVSTSAVALLLHCDGLRRVGVGLLASLVLWSLSRTGEGSGDVVIAGLVVVGPFLTTIIRSDRSLSPGRWLLGFCALVLPLLLLVDVPWCIAAMERVTRAFADPAVQADVADKGGALAHPLVWTGAYGVLLVTDYLRPLLFLVVGLSLWGIRGESVSHKLVLLTWTFIPWLALSWMQRKASWYGIVLVPPLLLWASIGLQRIGWSALRWVVFVGVFAQLVALSLVPRAQFPAGLAWLREPLPLHEWRLRRIDLLRPMDTAESQRVVDDLDRLISWLRAQDSPGPVALITMGTRGDYASRYYLSMQVEGLEVVNLTDPRLREAQYRSLHPDDFSALIFLDDGAQPWPPAAAQRAWLRENLHCAPSDPVDAFVQAVMSRAGQRRDGFYPLSGSIGSRLGPGQVWSGEPEARGLCAD